MTDLPSASARGGGLFPVLLLLDDGRLCCSTRTGSAHSTDASSEISLSFSDDRGRTWSDYRVVVKSRPEDNLDCRNQSLGQASDGHLVLTYGTIGGADETDSAGSHREMESIRSADGGLTRIDPHRPLLHIPHQHSNPIQVPRKQRGLTADGRSHHPHR